MAKTQAAPVAPAPEPTTPPAEDLQDIRPADSASLDDAAPLTEPTEDPPVRETPHSRSMNPIVAARHKVLERERAENQAQGLAVDPPAIGDDPLNPRDPAPALDVDARDPEPALDQDASATAPTPAAEGRVFKITVGGRQIDMPEGDVIRAAELGVVSEHRLREANRILEEAQRLRGAPPQPDPSARPSPPAASAPATQPSPPVNRDAALELARAIQFGDENEVADAILRMTPQPQQPMPQVDPQEIERRVVQRVEARSRLEQDLHTFASEYRDIVDDPDLTTLAGQYVQQLRAHYQQTASPRSELDLFFEAGNAVREKVKSWRGVAPQPDPQPAPVPTASVASARTVIKRATPNAPAAAAAVATPSAPRQKTGTDIVNDFRRARGQPVFT